MLKANEIAEVLKSQLGNLDSRLDVSETGTVLAVGDGVVPAVGAGEGVGVAGDGVQLVTKLLGRLSRHSCSLPR